MRLRLTERALRDLQGIEAVIEERNPAVLGNVMARITLAINRLALFPNLGRPLKKRPNTRQIAIAGLPFVIVYRFSDETVDVLTVFHTSQNPDNKVM